MDEQVDVAALVKELEEERRKRAGLEQRVSELAAAAEEAERAMTVRAELQRLGVAKVELAYRAVRDEVRRMDAAALREYLAKFVADNPELLPARIAGGSGAGPGQKAANAVVDLDKIRPGMSAEEFERVRQEIARVASLTLKGL
jgi:hypothetical protein